MLKKLNEGEIKQFLERYSIEIDEEILDVSFLEMFGFKSFLINGHYLIADNGEKFRFTDLKNN